MTYHCRYTSKMAIAEKELLETGIKIASEAVTNIRTVASLSMFKLDYAIAIAIN